MKVQRQVLALMMFAAMGSPTMAQEAVLGGDQEATPPPASWASRCISADRATPAECSMVQRAVMQGSGQVVGSVTLRFPSAGGNPIMLITVPLGLSLPGGVSYDIDGGAAQKLALETCDRSGCYASAQIVPEALAAMQKGQKLNVSFLSLNKQTVTLPMSLTGFTAAYNKTK
jgi:invasion protein IalB